MERLFDAPEEPPEDAQVSAPPASGPLAARMRPRSLADYVGQEHLLGEGSALRAARECRPPPTMVRFGAPRTGQNGTFVRLHRLGHRLPQAADGPVGGGVHSLRRLTSRKCWFAHLLEIFVGCGIA